MKGLWGRALWVDLSRREVRVWDYPVDYALDYVGGRGLAARVLWDFMPAGADPLGPENILVFAAGPLTGLAVNSGKIVVAAKSPLTGGYGDGNIGSHFAIGLRKSGFDALIVSGRARKPSYIYVENGETHILSAEALWGSNAVECERRIKEVHGRSVGVACIGPAGERLVRYAVVISQAGRAGGRPGIGAVMGSKNLKAVAAIGDMDIPVADPGEVRRLYVDSVRDVKGKDGYGFWVRQGTMATIEWSQAASVLPAYNFREGVFEGYRMIDGYSMEAAKVDLRSCPVCAMPCGNVVLDSKGLEAELDYENVAMLGSNLGIAHLGHVARINRVADEMGLDTISLGAVISFAMEATERKLLKEGIEWGDHKAAESLALDIAYRRGALGELLAEGVMRASEKLGGDSGDWAMHVKGLEISAYDCHAAPAMALAYGTSPIGAHHKDAWIIAWEVKTGRFEYSEAKVDKLIELQRIRGGIFETLVACRFPWVELGFNLEWYPKIFKAATGRPITLEEYYEIADRIYTLIRALWIREQGTWNPQMDTPPARWFKKPLTKGPIAGSKLDPEKYHWMLQKYYQKRGWDERGIPRKSTLRKLKLEYTIPELEKHTTLTE
ncbi:MAG: aldehyde ferredoxin oxidoreductase family protein [Thermoprotei archaeon]|nr:aldehyde ferredoxin oxidoreductase family protein [Thermoprotei archaeon]